MATLSNIRRDGAHLPIQGLDCFLATKSRTFDGTAGNGAQGATTLFTVTSDAIVRIFATCSEDVAGATATIEVGISGNTAALIAQTTGTDIDTGEVWKDTAPATVETLPSQFILTAGTDIIETIGTADITDGELTYYCLFYPLTSTANVVAA